MVVSYNLDLERDVNIWDLALVKVQRQLITTGPPFREHTVSRARSRARSRKHRTVSLSVGEGQSQLVAPPLNNGATYWPGPLHILGVAVLR